MFKAGMVAIAVWALALGAAEAADKPEVAPPQAWVHAPPSMPEPMKTAAGAALAGLMQDEQEHFDGEGEAFYNAYAVKVLSAEGLQAMGTVELHWAPITDRLVVHRVRILRGDQVIDALPKDGAFTIARREDKLDSEALLNGVLTVILPIEGLQVGDVVDVAYTLHRVDPLLKGRVDNVSSIANGAPVAFERIRVSWPQSTPVRWRASGGMPEPHVTNVGGFTEAEAVLENVEPVIKPRGAPARFEHDRELAVTSYLSWAEVSASMAPLYTAAMQLGPKSEVRAEADAIAARTADPERRAGAALALVEDKIRYLALTLGEGGLKPAAADDTWAHRYGDCKAKTVLLLALLNALGIKAEPVLISTTLGEDLDTRLPGLSFFDHVAVHAVIGGRDYWLDGTRSGDQGLQALDTPGFGFVLPVRPEGAALVRIVREPARRPTIVMDLRFDASKGLTLPAAAHVETVLRGDLALATRLTMGAMTAEDRDRALRAYWHKSLDALTVSAASISFDPEAGETRIVADGQARLDWGSDGYEPDGAVVGFKLDLERDPAAVDPGAPFQVAFPFYVVRDETVVLPDHGKGFAVRGANVDQTLGGYALSRQAAIEAGVFHMHTSVRSLVPEITLAEAKAAAPPLGELAKSSLRITPPTTAALTDEGLKALIAETPTTAQGYAKRGMALSEAQRYREAVHDFDRALALDPKQAWVLGARALAHVWLGESQAALADADQAELIDPREPTLYRARGLLAEKDGNWPEALANFTRSVDLDPNGFGYFHRARAYLMLKDYPRALRDYDAELAASPANLSIHLNKASVYMQMNDLKNARIELDAVKAAAADNDDLRAARLYGLVQLGDRKTAREEADAAVAAHPSAAAYLQRAEVRDIADVDGREGDAKAALALDPNNVTALSFLVASRLHARDYAAAVDWADKAHAAAPSDPEMLIARAAARRKLGQTDAARSDFAAARRMAKDNAVSLNDLCYEQATTGLDLDQALADCNASLALRKAPAAYDSRAFVLLRLGRMQEALADFNQALASAPDLAPSLYGRSLVERRLGDRAAADRDRAAALAKDPKIVETYAEYGVEG